MVFKFRITFSSNESIDENIICDDVEEAYQYMYEEYPDAEVECIDIEE